MLAHQKIYHFEIETIFYFFFFACPSAIMTFNPLVPDVQ